MQNAYQELEQKKRRWIASNNNLIPYIKISHAFLIIENMNKKKM